MAEKGVFLVTGGSRGIGKAIALEAAREGYCVLINYAAKKASADALVKEIQANGGSAHALQADISRESEVLRMFAECERLGRLSVLVCNAGIVGPNSTLSRAATQTLTRVLEVNVLGAMLCAREAVRRMSTLEGGAGGSIVFISSRAVAYGSAGQYVWYAASKGAVDVLSLGLAREVATQGIRVNTVSPGVIKTEVHAPGNLERAVPTLPMQRAGEPAEVAAAVMFLVSSPASYVSGANLAVGGAR